MKQKQKPLFSKEICYTKRLRVRTHVKFIMTCSISLFSAMTLALGTTAAVIHHNNYSGQGGGNIDFEITELLPQTGAYEISGSDDDNGENVESLLAVNSDEDIVQDTTDQTDGELNPELDAENPDIIAEEIVPALPAEDIAENYVETSLSYKVYRVKTGDTVGALAKNFGVTQDTIFSVNSNVITSAMSLRINSFLKIPSTSGVLYTVQKDGETLESICKKNNVETAKSEEANHITATEKLKNGTTVFLVGAKMDRGKLLELSGELFKKPLHSAYYISSRYGWRISPFDSSRRTHHGGVDMACPKGTSIYPTSEGKVITAGWSGIYGNYVIVQHHSGYKSLYGHMSQILCKKGDYVYTNNVIGKVGSTGQSTGPHLHFTIYKNDKAINPETKLAL
ncbi:MAG: M23 family metallopeptidase [Treponema sp.]|nr:M23 family metallopeptidase [Treponema sp.]